MSRASQPPGGENASGALARSRAAGARASLSERLHACRFCGASASTAGETRAPGGSVLWQVHCLNKRCGACGPWRTTPRAARRAWNATEQSRAAHALDRALTKNPWP